MFAKCLVIALLLAINCNALTIDGCCPKVTAYPNFDLWKFVGDWYIVKGYESAYTSGACIHVHYKRVNSTGVAGVVDQVVNGKLEVVTGSGVITSTDGSAIWDILLGTVSFHGVIPIIDYKGFFLISTCAENTNGTSEQNVWIYSRGFSLSPKSESELNEFLSSTEVVQTDALVDISQYCFTCS